ncbi:MAG: hypothetical protein ABI672_14705 [Vicinamibacteria bacterium]
MQKLTARNGSIVCAVLCYGVVSSAFVGNADAQGPPPMPPGSAKVKVAPGQSPEESQRMERAHEHHAPSESRKDYTRDDTTEQRLGLVPPPLPVLFAAILIVPGQSPEESFRMLRAHEHHHTLHYKKDFDKDDLTDEVSGSTKKPLPSSAR